MTHLREDRVPHPAARRLRRVVDVSARHPVVTIVLMAFVVRAVLALLVNVLADGALFQDDATYPLLAAQYAFGDTEHWGEYEYFLLDVTATLLYPLAWLYRLFGYSVLLGQLLVAAWAAAAAGLTTRIALESLSRRWALVPGAVVALLPSQVVFSSTVFKDAAVWAVLAGIGLVIALLGRSTKPRAVLLLVVLGVLYLLLAHLRLHTLVAAVWAAAISLVLVPERGLLMQRSGVLALALVVPLTLQLGVGGWTFVTDAGRTLEERRIGNASGAATAFIEPPPEAVAAQPPHPPVKPGSERPQHRPAEPEAETQHQPVEPETEGHVGGRDFGPLVRGLSVMLLEPYPTSRTLANGRMTLALGENLLWWPLLALGAVGAWSTLRDRSRLRVLAFPLLAGGAIVLLYALSEGNFGTAFRHRGEVVWAVALLAAHGASSWHARRGRRRRA